MRSAAGGFEEAGPAVPAFRLPPSVHRPALRSPRPAAVAVLVTVTVALGVACGNGGGLEATPTATRTATATSTGTATASPTATATVTATATGTSEVAGDVRELDFTDPAVIGPLIDHFGGGEVESERVQYLDLTGDGIEEALVFVASGGTAGDLGAAIVGARDGAPEVLHYIEVPGRIEVRFAEAGLGIVAALEPVYSAGDAECCPSQLRETVWQWDDGEFVVVSEQVIENPER